MVCSATFFSKTEKLPYVKIAVRKLDTIKIMLMVLWESGSFEDKKYIIISIPLNEAGKMLGGWHGQLSKQNSPLKSGEK